MNHDNKIKTKRNSLKIYTNRVVLLLLFLFCFFALLAVSTSIAIALVFYSGFSIKSVQNCVYVCVVLTQYLT